MKSLASSAGKKDKGPSLPDSELEVMRVLWQKGKATAREVLTDLRAHGSKWTYATVNTLLQRIESKGMATSDKSRMSYVYSPKISRDQVIKKRVRHLVEKLYDGKGGQLVVHVLRNSKLSKDEVTEISQLLGSL
jgi:predicted transcriptional regulator